MATDVEVNYLRAAVIHKKVYGAEINPNEIRKQVMDRVKASKGLLDEKGAFVMWLKELKLLDDYKKVRTVNGQNGVTMEKKEVKNGIKVDFSILEANLEDPDIIELFGDTGSLKTFIAFNWALEKAKAGNKVMYIDTERNMTKKQRELLKSSGCDYRCIINFDKLVEFITEKLPEGYNYLVLDSVGLPALGKFAVANMRGKGNVLLNVQAILYALKDYCVENDCYALVTNQPTSEMNKTEYFQYGGKKFIVTDPFGDKGSFFVKEIYRTIIMEQKPNKTVVDVIAWRSRVVGKLSRICRVVREGDEISITK
ncbi:hypothetical protein QIT38_gp26 [Methanocaldococcus fervens tailed virus 1]|uniref:Uncharacterized protein n=2 Tax=root TaxID=1 RepID=C7P5I8_METFA|nr:hypothetical protein [Methanocaldococcus fervens]YP_010772321.1 hypothetical protein QIT38_gp26 [Methanocaldococcus fervens tailed virus 1]ACV25366.1 hypothetical protein Mefer_1563 [Methanocaldococcus fervens AG86]QNO11496.1 hypothetical protein [Methanocaldococcus fervens tailed virus 1]